MNIFEQLIDTIKPQPRDVFIERLTSDINLIDTIVNYLEKANPKQIASILQKTRFQNIVPVDFSGIVKDFKSGRGKSIGLKTVIKDLDNIKRTTQSLIIVANKDLPKQIIPRNLSVQQLAILWYILNINYIINYQLTFWNAVITTGLHEDVVRAIGISKDEQRYIEKDAYNAGITERIMTDHKQVIASINNLPGVVYENIESVEEYVSSIAPGDLNSNAILQTHGLFGGAILSIRTWWLYAVDKWYQLLATRIERLSTTLNLLELQETDNWSPAMEARIEELSNKIQKMEYKLKQYHNG